MSLDDFYWRSIQSKKKGNMIEYNETVKEVCGSEKTWEEVKNLDSDKQITIMCKLEERIKIKKSPYDIRKLAIAIQHSRSGAGGCAMTKFTCAFCGEEELWGNTATPKICIKCATKMASTIVHYGFDIMK